jgi:ABC-type antimicrobial peptide transport system permease subunit
MKYNNRDYILIGVITNVVMGSPYEPVKPMMFLPDQNHSNFFVIRLKKGVKPQDAVVSIRNVFKKYNPGYPFEYKFTNEQFNDKFITEDLISKLTNVFAGLAIIICCLGLWGLTTFTIEKRFKEIGIRKVLGASVQQLLLLIAREFLFLVIIAFLICLPISWWLLHNWLQNYTYRIDFSLWLFIGSGAGVLFLTLIIVCLNSIKAALANPVKNLRTE